MSLEQKILRLIVDDQRYIQYISQKTKDTTTYKIINIPEESFLSKSFQELTFDELSQYLKVVFLGETPLNWKISKKNIPKRISKLLHEISRNVYMVQALRNEVKYFYGRDVIMKDDKCQNYDTKTKMTDIKNRGDILGSLVEETDMNEYTKIQKNLLKNIKKNPSKREAPYLKKRINATNSLQKRKKILKCFKVDNKRNNFKHKVKTRVLNIPDCQNIIPQSIRNIKTNSIVATDFDLNFTERGENGVSLLFQDVFEKAEGRQLPSLNLKCDRKEEGIHKFIKPPIPRKLQWSKDICSKHFLTGKENGLEMVFNQKMLVLIAPKKENKMQSPKQPNVPLLSCLRAWKWNELYIQIYKSDFDDNLIINFKTKKKTKFIYLFLPKYRRYTKEIFTFRLNDNCRLLNKLRLENTICLERSVIDPTSEKSQNSHLLYFLRANSGKSLAKLYTFLRTSNLVLTCKQLPVITLPDQKLSLCLPKNKRVYSSFDYLSSYKHPTKKILETNLGYKEWSTPVRRFINVSIMEMTQVGSISFNPLKYEEGLYQLRGNVARKLTETELNQLWNFASHTKDSFKYFLKKKQLTSEKDNQNGLKFDYPIENNIEGFAQEIKKTVIGDSSSLSKLRSKKRYLFVLKNLLFLIPSECAIIPFLTEIKQNIKIASKSYKGPPAHIIDPLILNKHHHIPWLSNELKLEDYEKNDYNYFNHFCRKISLILYSVQCIDLTAVTALRLESLESSKKTPRYSKNLLNTQHNFGSSSVVVLNRGKSNVKFLFSSEHVANEWMTHLTLIMKYWKEFNRKATSFRNKDNDISNKSLVPKSTNNGGVSYFGNARLISTNNSVISILIYHGILYVKTGRYNIFKKYLVVLIPGTLLLFKTKKRSFSRYNEDTLKYTISKMVSLENSYIYCGNSNFRGLLSTETPNDFHKFNNNHIPKIYDDGWKTTEDQFSRSFTIHFGSCQRNSMTKINEEGSVLKDQIGRIFPKEPFRYLKTNNKPSNLDSLHFLSNKTTHYFQQHQIFLTRSEQERDLWVALISKEIERLQ